MLAERASSHLRRFLVAMVCVFRSTTANLGKWSLKTARTIGLCGTPHKQYSQIFENSRLKRYALDLEVGTIDGKP